jgi:hypothetical protein
MPAAIPSQTNILTGPLPPYVSAEAVTLTGGAGADWVPTKAQYTRALWVGGTGTVKVDMADGSIGVSFLTVPAGYELKVAVTKVYNTTDGTTASNIVAVY